MAEEIEESTLPPLINGDSGDFSPWEAGEEGGERENNGEGMRQNTRPAPLPHSEEYYEPSIPLPDSEELITTASTTATASSSIRRRPKGASTNDNNKKKNLTQRVQRIAPKNTQPPPTSFPNMKNVAMASAQLAPIDEDDDFPQQFPLPTDEIPAPPDEYMAPRLARITDQMGVTRDGQSIWAEHYIYGGNNGTEYLLLHIVVPWQYFYQETVNVNASLANLRGDLILLEDFKRRYRINGDLSVSGLRKVQVYRAKGSHDLVLRHHVLRYEKKLDIQQCLEMLQPNKGASTPQQQPPSPPMPTDFQSAMRAGFNSGFNRRDTNAEKYIKRCGRYCTPHAICVMIGIFIIVAIFITLAILLFGRVKHYM